MESKVTEMFGSQVFDEITMKARLPKETFKQLMKTIQDGEVLDPSVANAMKDWAIEKGATHWLTTLQKLLRVVIPLKILMPYSIYVLIFILFNNY